MISILNETGHLHLRFQSHDLVIDHWSPAVEIDGELFTIRDADPPAIDRASALTLHYRLPRKKFRWQITIRGDDDQAVIDSTLFNDGDTPVILGKVFLMDAETAELGAPGDEIMALNWKLWHGLRVYRLDDPELPHESKVHLQLYNRTRTRALQIGFLTFQRADTRITYEPGPGSRLSTLKCYCDFAGWSLAPGQRTMTETLRILAGKKPLDQLVDWAKTAGELCGAKIWDQPPIGYLGWSWVDCINGKRTYEDVALETLDAINARLGGFGVHYLWTSMTNIEGSLPGNWLKWNTQCIPSGREAFIRKVRDKGFLPGLWIGPFYLCSTLKEMMDELENAILRNPDGSPMIVEPEWSHGDAGKLPKEERPCLYAVDPSHPKVLAFIRRIFETYHEWGIRYFMVDFLEAGAGNLGRFHYQDHYDKSLVAGPEVYTNFLRTMKSAAGADTYLLSSTGPSLHHAGILDGVRVGNDFGEGRALSPDSFFYPATYVINQLDFWTGPQGALDNQAANFHTHRRLYLNDSGNVLTVDKPLPLTHARIAATIHAFSGSATMLGDDIRTIGSDRLALIKKTLPRGRETGIPVDLFDSPHPEGSRVFHRRIDKPWGRFDVVALYNLDKVPLSMDLDLSRLDLDAGKEYLVWDFWNEALVGKAHRTVPVYVPPETVIVFRLTENLPHPVIAGTDMHVMMGEMEILDFSYDPATRICRLEATRPAGEAGMIFLHTPPNVHVINFDGLHIAKDGRDRCLVIGVPMTFDQTQKARWEIQFGEINVSIPK